ncbi:MAG: hypothetical protein ACREMR_00700 [Gemmatimonadales bacterium]
MPERGWARCSDTVADVLRRGAWYPIVEETSEHVVVEVRRRPVYLSRDDVAVRRAPPDHWSVVVRTGVLRPTLGGAGAVTTRYAVCPRCHHRQDVEGAPAALRCDRCRETAPVDWSETC